jgi:hypothetical protein
MVSFGFAVRSWLFRSLLEKHFPFDHPMLGIAAQQFSVDNAGIPALRSIRTYCSNLY